MASAPPLETTTFVGHPTPPSYEETITNALYPPGGPMLPHPSADAKVPQPPYSTQTYGQIYPQPPQGQPITNSVVSVQTVCVQTGKVLREAPVQTNCPVCTQNVITHVDYTPGLLTWLSCAGLLFLGGFSGCCLIPFYVNSLKDVTHYCPICGSILGVCKRL